MTSVQGNMMDTTNLPSETNKEPVKDLSLESLTDQNWLFIKHYLETADIQKSYTLAGYEGTALSNPYNVFKRLKPFIEELGNLAVTSRLKLVADLNKVLSIPLQKREDLSVSEWLRVRKFAATLVPEIQSKPTLSVIVVNRYSKEQTPKEQAEVAKPINPTFDIPLKDVIDITPNDK